MVSLLARLRKQASRGSPPGRRLPHGSPPIDEAAGCGRRPLWGHVVWWSGALAARVQWLQAEADPAESAVRKLDPQPHAATAFGLFTVKPAPMSVST